MKHCDRPGLDGVLIPALREQPPRLQSSTEGESEVRSGRPRAPRGCYHKKEGCMLAQRKQEKPATRCRKWEKFQKITGKETKPSHSSARPAFLVRSSGLSSHTWGNSVKLGGCPNPATWQGFKEEHEKEKKSKESCGETGFPWSPPSSHGQSVPGSPPTSEQTSAPLNTSSHPCIHHGFVHPLILPFTYPSVHPTAHYLSNKL